ncbi:hypothetical protein GJ688_02790 [Heliobacillus mobilis]|uniref:Glycerol-3-phosphate acyltransferase n=1 Tax=Heliobacterium mobile TaxID=28064 RepID=A0A6I3SGF2_HELMO|nr:glycerol-3-phosphate acyltransferase [Heliobacterium mobile]MTV47909.1 hypothetical protein [Heliobacterium mobile]
MFTALALFCCAYLMGALPLAYWVGRLGYSLAVDDYGPGSVGPVKLLRLAGADAMLLAFLLESAKGVFIGCLATWFQVHETNCWVALLFLALGHGWSPVLFGRGGNVWVPLNGLLLWLAPDLGRLSVAVALSFLLLTRSPSLSASAAMAALLLFGSHLSTTVLMVLSVTAAAVFFQTWLIRCHQMPLSKI